MDQGRRRITAEKQLPPPIVEERPRRLTPRQLAEQVRLGQEAAQRVREMLAQRQAPHPEEQAA